MRTYSGFAVLVTVAIVCCGCGGKYSTHTVRGRIALPDGTPLDDVEVTFQCEEPPITATGLTDSTGNYALGTVRTGDGAPAGTYRVAVVELDNLSDPDNPRPPRIAPHYASLQGSGLEITVPSRDGYDLTLQPPSR